MTAIKILPSVGLAAALACLVAGCALQAPPASASAPVPLQEPFPGILGRWNYYRANAGVLPIVDDPALNEAALHHAKYLVDNHIKASDATIVDGRMIETGWNASAHAESEGNRWYTEDGAKWSEFATVIHGTARVTDGTAMLDEQATRTDSIAIVDPQLGSVGFGMYCEKDDCVGVIVYQRGLAKSQFLALYEGNGMDWNSNLGTMPFTVARLRKPIEFPPSAMEFPSRAFRGGDYPDPLSGCHGYSEPTGVVIILQLGAPTQGENVKLSSSSLSDGGVQLEACAFDATSYANPDGSQQRQGRQVLHAYGAVVMIPKDQLLVGHTYTVSIVADSQPYTWSFSIAPAAK